MLASNRFVRRVIFVTKCEQFLPLLLMCGQPFWELQLWCLLWCLWPAACGVAAGRRPFTPSHRMREVVRACTVLFQNNKGCSILLLYHVVSRAGKSTEMSSISSDRGAMTALPDNFLSLNGDDGLSEQGEVDGRVFDSEMNRSFLQI